MFWSFKSLILPCFLLYFFQMSWFRALSFGIKGYCDFTRPAFIKAQKTFKPLQDDLTGKVVVITGGNSGIGFEAAIKLAKVRERISIPRFTSVLDGCRSPHCL